MPEETILTTKDIMKIYGVGEYCMRSWRRGWWSDSRGKHYFFEDHRHLECVWNEEKRRFEYDVIKVAVWVHQMRKHISEVRTIAGRKGNQSRHAKRETH